MPFPRNVDKTGSKRNQAYISPYVRIKRQPTSEDIKDPRTGRYFEISTFWHVDKDPQTGERGELFYLASIIDNVADWRLFTTGDESDFIKTVTGDDSVEVDSDDDGNINFNGIMVVNGENAKPVFFKGDEPNNLEELEIQVTTALASAPADKNDAGLASFDVNFFTVDENGFVSMVEDTKACEVVYWKASDFDVPETNYAELLQDSGSNEEIIVRSFDDTTEEFANFSFTVPDSIDTTGDVTFKAYIYAKTAVASRFVQLRLGYNNVDNDDSWDVAYTNLDSGDVQLSSVQNEVTKLVWTESVSNLGWGIGDLVTSRLSRISPSGTNLSGDLYLIGFAIEYECTTVDAGGSGSSDLQIMVDTQSGAGTNPVLTDSNDEVTIVGGAVAAHSVPVQTHSKNVNEFDVDVQVSSSVSTPVDKSDAGLASFNEDHFDVDEYGHVSLDHPTNESVPLKVGAYNLGLYYSSGTATIKGSDENDLSASNPGYIVCTSNVTDGKLIVTKLESNHTFDDVDGASSIFDGSLFGFNTGDDTTTKTTNTGGDTGVVFYLYAVLDDTDSNLIFAVSPRSAQNKTVASGGSTILFNAGSGDADLAIDMLTTESVTVADYRDVNQKKIAAFKADKTSGDDWRIKSISNSTMNFSMKPVIATPFSLGVMGASTNSVFIDNGGTAPTVNSTSVIRFGEATEVAMLNMSCNIILSGSPSGAVDARMIAPPKTNIGATPILVPGYIIKTGSGSIYPIIFRRNSGGAGTEKYFELLKADGTSGKWQYDEFDSGDVIVITSMYYY